MQKCKGCSPEPQHPAQICKHHNFLCKRPSKEDEAINLHDGNEGAGSSLSAKHNLTQSALNP
eukprot:1160430-Pelagomonas_calceolata.AAC.6